MAGCCQGRRAAQVELGRTRIMLVELGGSGTDFSTSTSTILVRTPSLSSHRQAIEAKRAQLEDSARKRALSTRCSVDLTSTPPPSQSPTPSAIPPTVEDADDAQNLSGNESEDQQPLEHCSVY